MIIRKVILKIRRRETRFYSNVYWIISKIRRLEIPCIKTLHGFLYMERKIRLNLFRWLGVKLYYEPLFKSQCVSVGNKFSIIRGAIQGIPYITGNPYIVIGDNVTLHSVMTLAGNKVYDKPVLKIGDNTYIGSRVTINVAQEITIGSHCYLADNILLRDNDGHPTDFRKRCENHGVDKKDVKPIRIGNNVWIGSGSIILKGITIGEAAIIGSGSVVTKDVEPFTVVAGNPAIVVKHLEN